MTRGLDLFDPQKIGLQDSSWNISIISLVTLAATFLCDIVRKKQTHRQTEVKLYPATAVGLGNYKATSNIMILIYLVASTRQ